MVVVKEVLEKVAGIIWSTLECTICCFCTFLTVILTKRYEGQNEIFFLISNLEFCHFYIRDLVLEVKHFLFLLVDNFFCFLYKHVRPIFAFCLCRSCHDQGLPCFQYNANFQRHVYLTISDLSQTNLSKLNADHDTVKITLTRVSLRWQLV